MKKPISCLLAVVLALGLFGGCAPAMPTPIETPIPTPTQTAAPEGGIALTDQTGRTVTLEKPAEKIVSGYYISTSACIALGLKDKMVGIENKLIPIYDMAAPEFNDLPKVGTAKEFDLEGCIALNPDLVILPKKLKDAAETLAGLGIPVLLVSPENQEQLVEMLTLIGAATGTEERANRLAATYQESAAKLAALTEGLTERPAVYMGGNGSILTTAPKDMYQASLIGMGGGVNVGDSLEGDSWTEVSYEQLLAMNPDVILLPSDAAYTVDDVKQDPQLAQVDAVKNGAVYAIPGEIEAWDSPVPSCFLGSEFIMMTLHPDLFSRQDFVDDMGPFYSEFYSLDVGISFKDS